MEAKITTNADHGTFTHTKGAWSGTFQITDMQRWLAFYRSQLERYPAQASIYEVDIQALTAALEGD